MSLAAKLFAFVAAVMFFVAILYIIFGQVTVRKLRRNPVTKHALGIEFASGLDIINVAQAFAFPTAWSRKLKASQLSAFHADADLLYEHTTKFDRLLGATFYWLLMTSTIALMSLAILDGFDLFD